jgi:polyhydroxyalkanoate synthesis regulator phasin
MDKEIATAEIEYRLSKWLILNMVHLGLLTEEEAAKIVQELLIEYKPPCACLETVVPPNE